MAKDNYFPSGQTKMMASAEIDALQEKLRQEQLDPTIEMTPQYQQPRVRRYGANINCVFDSRPDVTFYFGSYFAEPGIHTQEFTTGIVFGSEEELKEHLDRIFVFAKSGKKTVEINDYFGKPNMRKYVVPVTKVSDLNMPWGSIMHHDVIDVEVQLPTGSVVSGSYDTGNILAVPFVEYTTGPLFRSEKDLLEHVQKTFSKVVEIRKGIHRRREFSTWGKDDYLYGRARIGNLEPGTSVEALVVNLERKVLYQ